MNMLDTADALTARDFERAHNRAFFRKVLALLSRRTGETKLLSFDDVRQKISLTEESYIGLRTVPIDAIVGSVGRYKDFDREFLPIQRATRQRWRRVDKAHYQEIDLPPVQLYKVGDVYFVKDGNHRVSVAREQGVEFIDAEVIECRTKAPLTADVTVDDLNAIAEYVNFLEWSNLDQLRPDQDVRLSVPGGYARLKEHIEVHRYYLGEERGGPVPLKTAVASWYDNVYMPVVGLIREENILKKFPDRTETDLYLWIMDHLYFLKQRYGDRVDVEDAAMDFAERYGKQPLLDSLRELFRALSGAES